MGARRSERTTTTIWLTMRRQDQPLSRMNHVSGQPIDPFQLVYGCGMFVSQLPERVTGVDSNETLLGQSVSVECGQLAFIAVLLSAVYCVRRLVPIPSGATIASAYAIGIVAAFWCAQRLDAMFS